MTESHEFRDVTHFTAGAVGSPGARTFFLQAGDAERMISVKLEKQQVAALATFLRSVIDDLPSPATPDPTPTPLSEPALAEWVVGQIAVGVDEVESRVILVVEELDTNASDDDEDANPILADVSLGSSLRIHLTVDQATSFIATADLLMQKGRPPCRLCGQPLDPDGHACPRLN